MAGFKFGASSEDNAGLTWVSTYFRISIETAAFSIENSTKKSGHFDQLGAIEGLQMNIVIFRLEMVFQAMNALLPNHDSSLIEGFLRAIRLFEASPTELWATAAASFI